LDSIAQLHGLAYGWEPTFKGGDILRHLGAKPARTHVRAALEFLDLQMLYARDGASGAIAVPDSEGLVEAAMTADEEVWEETEEGVQVMDADMKVTDEDMKVT
jgi:hypothetical protein